MGDDAKRPKPGLEEAARGARVPGAEDERLARGQEEGARRVPGRPRASAALGQRPRRALKATEGRKPVVIDKTQKAVEIERLDARPRLRQGSAFRLRRRQPPVWVA